MAKTSTKQYTGMFDALGIDTRTQEQILSQRAQDQLEASRQPFERDEVHFGERDLRRAGSEIGGLLRNKFNKPKLTDQEQTSVDALSAAQTLYEEKRDRGAFLGEDGKPDIKLESIGFNRAVAGELLKIGDPRGMELAQQIDRDFKADRKDNLAFEAAGLSVESQKRKRAEDIFDFDNKKFLTGRGEVVDFWAQGETDPNNSKVGFMRQDGTIVAGEGVEWPMETYMRQKPVVAKNGKGNSLDIKDYINLKDVGILRGQHTNLAGQMTMAVAMSDAISSGIGEDGTIEMMGSGGKITAAAVRLVDNMQSIGRTLGDFFIESSDGGSLKMNGSFADADRYVRNNKDFFTGEMVPQNIRDQGADATARYQAIIVQFAYGKARMNEPGGRISDNDFKNGVRQIGANATSPEQLRQILVGDINRAVENFHIWDVALPDEIRFQIIQPPARKIFAETKANFDKRFAQPFGTSLNPTEAIINPQGQSKDFLDTNFTPTENAVIQGLQAEQAALQQELEALQGNRSGN